MAEHDEETAQVHDFLFWLAPLLYDQYHGDYFSRRLPGTLELFLSSTRYTDWVQGEVGVNRSTLLIGESGVGKTILVSAITDDLRKRFSEKADVGIAYLYCTRQNRGLQKTSDLCLGITAQLSAQCLTKKRSHMAGGLPNKVDHLYRMKNWSRIRPTEDEVWQSLKSAVSVFEKTFIVVDGIDEMEEKSRREILKKLRVLMRIFVGIRMLISSRVRDGIVEIFEGEKEGIGTVEIWAQEGDLMTYIDGELDQFPQFLHDDQHLRMELKQKVMAASSGSFLRAHLYMRSLGVRSTYESLQGSLLMLPATPKLQYEEAVATLMQNNDNCQGSVMVLAKQVLKWLVFSKRQLTFSELRYALAIDSECPQFNLEKLPTMENIPDSGGLVHINYASRTVRTHHSQIEDYLRQTVERWCPGAQREIAQACLAFLSLSAFETGPCKSDAECEERKSKWPLLEYAALYWSQHAQDAKSSFLQAVELLQDEQKREAAWQIMRTVQVYPLRQDKDNTWSEKYSKDANALHVAAYCGVSSIFRDLLEGEDVHIVQRDSYGFTPLAWAACGGHQDIMKLIMDNTDPDLDARDYNGRTPMSLAAENGQLVSPFRQ
ncbi:hypothetical protein F4678DRAFT_238252 [Xylaria arbuscula]|nr:hypothetical protein F4678DRAFT_238252 [Xylaria arbuscula]